MDSPPSKVKPSFQNISGRKGTLKSLLVLRFYPGGKATHHAPQPTSLKASCCAAVVSLAEATLPPCRQDLTIQANILSADGGCVRQTHLMVRSGEALTLLPADITQ